MRPIACCLVIVALAAAGAPQAAAEIDDLDISQSLELLAAALQPEEQLADPVHDALIADPFEQGNWQLSPFFFLFEEFGDDEETVMGGGLNVGYFVLDDISVNAEFTGVHVDQEGKDAAGGGFSLGARWHLYRQDRFSVFVECFLGLMETNRRAPGSGTHFNYTVQPGLGITYRLWENAHLIAAGRYFHLSNADKHGVSRNPSIDAVGGFAGMMFTF